MDHLNDTSKNMMKFWANFARNGDPGKSSNGIKWLKYQGKNSSNVIILDNKKNLSMDRITNLIRL